MYHFLRIGIVSLYVLLTGIGVLFVLALFGVYISWLTLMMALTGWILFCFLSVYIRGPVYLFFRGRLRPPILEEELRLQGCFEEVRKNAGFSKKIRLLVIEVEEEEVFAFNHDIIAISKSLLNKLADNELKGVFAHELGHLLSKDTWISWAFVTAADLPRMARRIVRLFIGRLFILMLLAAALFLFLLNSRLALPVFSVVIFFLVFSLLDGLFRWLRLAFSRLCEYRQDTYAHRLGYGAGLREGLKKMAQYGREHVNTYFILMNGTRPVIYHRIRRLERLLDLRV